MAPTAHTRSRSCRVFTPPQKIDGNHAIQKPMPGPMIIRGNHKVTEHTREEIPCAKCYHKEKLGCPFCAGQRNTGMIKVAPCKAKCFVDTTKPCQKCGNKRWMKITPGSCKFEKLSEGFEWELPQRRRLTPGEKLLVGRRYRDSPVLLKLLKEIRAANGLE